ncbi:mechanosensitive ion channel protein MscS [Minwuia thermotolerans]|uniref:Small-conductance mechanosensitive channel n=2 Tax=Minwuia thermotolerans TaxID=2056226 RepID=A0A2M9FW19_9PROT|nr:mechanosensitive ion channel protein MscS [Minwuia thermotolerans]
MEASNIGEFLTAYFIEYGLAVIGVVIILIAGYFASNWAARLVRAGLMRTGKMDPMVARFTATIARYGVLVFAVIAALDQFGVETTSFVAVLAAAGFAIGLAFQGTLGNLSAGVMILVFKPFRQGDYIEGGGTSGTVEDVHLFMTELKTPDNVQIIMPNGQLWNTAIKNYSFHPTRRLDLLLGIGYGADIGAAIEAIREMANADERVHPDPAPMVVVSNLGESSVDLTIRLWCNATDYWGLKWEFTRALKEKMDELGVEIPFPQRTVHMVKDAAD